MFVGMPLYESSDIESVWTSLAEGNRSLPLPATLQIQLFTMDFPQLGKVLTAIATWVDDDHEEDASRATKSPALETVLST